MSDDSSANDALGALRAAIKQAVMDVREQTPLAQSFTNFVTINLVANAQLAAGGTAAMSYLPDDVIATAEIAGSNYINVGTLLPFFKDALPEIARKLHENGKTWVLDPVAAGIGETRTFILESFRDAPPTIVRGNASEVIALDAMWGAQSFTNFVTINLVANAQLAAGGTAAMSYLPDDVIATAEIAGSNYINVGTLLPFFKDALPEIARKLHENGKTWVLDPVAAGIGETRTFILESFRDAPPTIVRGNASEVIALDAMWGLADADSTDPTTRPAGVEAVDEVDAAIDAAKRVARHLAKHSPVGKGAVAVSGAVDLVTDGERTFRLPGGSAMMTKITGAGCSLGGVTATYLAVAEPLVAALAASLLYDRASEIAEVKSDGPGSFQVALLDALRNVTADQVAASDIIETN